MSYASDNPYRQAPPLPPRPYQDEQQRYQEQGRSQNGGQYPQHSYTYPGQATYQHGGPVQSPQPGHTLQSMYSPQPGAQHTSPHLPYNPANYSPHVGGGQIPAYNPASYAQTTPTQYQSHFGHNQYQTEGTTQATSGPLDDPYNYHYGASTASPAYYTPPPAISPHVSPPPPPPSHSYAPPDAYRQYASHSVSPPPVSNIDESWRPTPPIYSSATSPPEMLPSPPVSTPGPTPPAHTHFPARTESLRHPQSRPLPGPPGAEVDSSYFAYGEPHRQATFSSTQQLEEDFTQDELFAQVENAVMNAGRNTAYSPATYTASPAHRTDTFYSTASPRTSGQLNGQRSPTVSGARYSDDSDPEGAAGLAAMRMDEARERRAEEADRRRSSGTARMSLSPQQVAQPLRMPMPEHHSDSDDFHMTDMGTLAGGYGMNMTRAADPNQNISNHSSIRRSHASQSSHGEAFTAGTTPVYVPPPHVDVRVDHGGTGGMYEPTADGRRPSFDEGDEYTFNGGDELGSYPEFLYHGTPGSTYRPLPAPPTYSPETYIHPIQTDLKGQTPFAPDGYEFVDANGLYVPRSTSLTNHSNTPPVNTPLRSKTDAEATKKGFRISGYASTFDMTPATAGAVALDLPSLAAKRFIASKLGAPDFKKCEEPWGLSSILSWLLDVTTPESTTELKEAAVVEALVALFTSKVPTMNIADAETLAARVVQEMYAAGALQQTEEWVKLVRAPMAGVIFQLTGTGCYSPTLHDHIVPGRCYSHYCQRTLKKVNLATQPARTGEDWASFYKLGKDDIADKDRKEIERQNVLHEIVQTEDDYMEQLNILLAVYRDPLVESEPSIITPKRKDNFIKEVFGRVDAVKQANEEHLLPQLKYRQQEQGPWLIGFSDIFRQWIRKAKAAYIDYAGAFPSATFTVRRETELNIQFAQFLEQARTNKRGARLGWDTYLKAPITRLQRYSLLLQTVLKNMTLENEEKANLRIAVEEVKAVTLECDTRVADMQRKVDLTDLASKLVLRPGMQNAVELNLNHLGRELLHQGDLQRMGDSRFTWLDCHALLFDHYLVLAKTVSQRAEQGGRFDKYDVSRLPIPMDLLVLESANDYPVQKSSYVKGITTVSNVTAKPYETPVLTKNGSTQSMPTLSTTNTGMSTNSMHTVTSIESAKDSERILYPFKIKHLGRDTYTLFAYSEQARKDWCQKIIEAKTRHAAALFQQSAEPFRLRIMADSAFVYETLSSKGILIKGTPTDRALNEVAHRFRDTGRPGPVCRVRVNCATSFSTPYPGKQMTAVGTDNGIYISEHDNPRGWTKAITIARVTQIAVLEEFNLFLMIADKQLIAYHLDVVCPNDRNGPAPSNDSLRRAPQKLSGHKDVGFFVSGKMKDRTLLFYKKRENMSSTFKVLEPIYQKSTEKKRGMFKRSNTESFREYDEFYIPAECNGINLFHSSLGVSTARGFEILTLDRKHTVSVPDLQPDHVHAIKEHLKERRALCMLRISDQEFLLCYDTCAVYINKHGEVSRSVIMEFIGQAQTVAMCGAYIVLFDNDFVEIRNAQNGRLKQIIAGRDIRCLDDGGCWTAGNAINTAQSAAQRSVKFVMQHPEMEKSQIVVELLLNEGMKE